MFELADLAPRGGVFFPRLVPILNERFCFQKYPSAPDDFDSSKGIVFENGFFEGQSVSNLTIYDDGIKVDLRSSTESGQSLIQDTLRWMVEKSGITFSDQMPLRWGFLSQVTFVSELDLDVIHPALQRLATDVSNHVNERTRMDLAFRTSAVSLNFERVNGDIPIAAFTIERRSKTPFSQHKYYSVAPLDTESHIRLLEQFEKNVKSSMA